MRIGTADLSTRRKLIASRNKADTHDAVSHFFLSFSREGVVMCDMRRDYATASNDVVPFTRGVASRRVASRRPSRIKRFTKIFQDQVSVGAYTETSAHGRITACNDTHRARRGTLSEADAQAVLLVEVLRVHTHCISGFAMDHVVAFYIFTVQHIVRAPKRLHPPENVLRLNRYLDNRQLDSRLNGTHNLFFYLINNITWSRFIFFP